MAVSTTSMTWTMSSSPNKTICCCVSPEGFTHQYVLIRDLGCCCVSLEGITASVRTDIRFRDIIPRLLKSGVRLLPSSSYQKLDITPGCV
jgi:hypothetical protein